IIEGKLQNEPIDRFINYEKYVQRLSTADLKKVDNSYLNDSNLVIATRMPEKYAPVTADRVAMRKNVVVRNIPIKSPQIKVELYDNGDVDGDEVTVYFNGKAVS